jgi:NAD(P)-dependent dehydrogenase (short-subunit alcohol dehydrogenase family)
MKIPSHSFLISGGGSGLGAACVRWLADRGANVMIADVNPQAGRQLADGLGASVAWCETDVTDAQSVQAAVEATVELFGGFDGVVNCAGIALAERLLGKEGPHALETFSRVIEVNLIGTFNVVRLAAAVIAQQEPGGDGERGVIINTASIAAFDGQIGQAAYASSKGGIASMTLPLARELARFGIRVMTIAPGVFETPLLGKMPEEARESLSAQVPFPSRLGRPDEYAALVQHVIENVMLNGEVIRLDGALRMASK